MPSLALQSSSGTSKKCTPHIIPCRIHHNGKIAAPSRYWNPREDTNGISKRRAYVAYFRGRKLKGTMVDVPKGYKGVVLRRSNELAEVAAAESDEEECPEETYKAEEEGSFDSFVVWGHDLRPDPAEDPYIRGIDEWIGLAETMHGSSSSDTETGNPERGEKSSADD